MVKIIRQFLCSLLLCGKLKGAGQGRAGQIALVLILLTAVALIFLSVTLNWGRVAQTKTMLTIAADQAAAMLASDAASYGEMEKQTNLQDTNQISAMSAVLMDIIMVVVAIVILVITICSAGAGAALFIVLAAIAVVMAVITLVLELTVIQPGMCALWNKLQQDQPVQQQFYEGAIAQALQGSITDQVNITDYFDSNANGRFGIRGTNTQVDAVGRFAFFYTDRLKMLNRGAAVNSQVDFFYQQLMEFMNGETCYQNFLDASSGTTHPTGTSSLTNVPLNETCIDPTARPPQDYCAEDIEDPACTQQISNFITCSQNASENNIDSRIPLNSSCPRDCLPTSKDPTPTDTACQREVPNSLSFQLNDSCTDGSNPSSSAYNPYCDPCCQPVVVNGKAARPSQCWPSGWTSACIKQPTGPGCACTPTAANPHPELTNPQCIPSQCYTNNPYGDGTGASPSFPFLYDASYQEFANDRSFLDQYGRDQQIVASPLIPLTLPTGTATTPTLALPAETTANALPPTSMTFIGQFPNGIFPFFWLMGDYSPQVDNISNPTGSNLINLTPAQVHWCVNGTGAVSAGGNGVEPAISIAGYSAPSAATLKEFPELTQLGSAPYTMGSCTGNDCCVQYLADGLTSNNSQTSSPIEITVGSGPTIIITSPAAGAQITAGVTGVTVAGTASEAGTSDTISITINSIKITGPNPGGGFSNGDWSIGQQVVPGTPYTVSFSLTAPPSAIPTCYSPSKGAPATFLPTGQYTITVTATDNNNNSSTASTTIQVTNSGGVTCGTNNCGEDSCGAPCGPGPMTAPNYGCPPVNSPTMTTCSSSTTPGTCSCVSSPACGANNCNQDNCGNPCAACPSGETCSTSKPYTIGTCS